MNVASTVLSAADESQNRLRRSAPVTGMVLFILCEAMFFAAIVSAYLVTSARAEEWPPPDLPALPVGESAFNAFVLVISGLFIYLGGRSERGEDEARRRERSGRIGTDESSARETFHAAGLVCGAAFVFLQGGEWLRVLGSGLSYGSGAYGSFFYLIVAAHGLHVCGALALLAWLLFPSSRREVTAESLLAARLFWYFVVGLWPLLYAMVYLYPGIVS